MNNVQAIITSNQYIIYNCMQKFKEPEAEVK